MCRKQQDIYQRKLDQCQSLFPLFSPWKKGTRARLTPCLPGMVQCQIMRFTEPSGNVSGFATKPYRPKLTSNEVDHPKAKKEAKKQGKVKGRSGRRHGDDSCARTSAPPLACRELCLPTSFFRSPFLALSSRRQQPRPLPFPLPVSSTNIYLHAGYQNQKIKNVGPQNINPKLHPDDPSHQHMTSLPIY